MSSMGDGEPSVKQAGPRGRQRAVPTNRAELKRRRIAAGLSLGSLGAIAGTGRANLSQIERGRYNAGADLLFRLAAALGCEPADLMASENGNGGTP